MLPVIIFVGTFSGVFTANEAAVVACIYAFIVELFIHKTMKFKDVKKVVVGSAVTSATLLIIVAGATCFGRYLTFETSPARSPRRCRKHPVPGRVSTGHQSLLLGGGMFLDVISATLIIGPVVIRCCPPSCRLHALRSAHDGQPGHRLLHPPVGVSMYITGAMTNKDIVYVTKAVIPSSSSRSRCCSS